MSRKRKQVEAFSLFAFQDIITSVTGIIILITLFLAIELMERTENTPEKQTVEMAEQTEETSEALQQEIAKYKKILESNVQGISELPSTDPDTLKRMVAENEEKQKQLDGKIANSQKQLEKKTKEAKVLSDRESKEGAEGDAEQRRLAAAIEELEKKLKKLSSSRLVFNEGELGKNTWIVEVNKNGFRCAQIGVSSAPRTFSTQSNFLTWLKSNSAFQIYFCVKPNGINSFNVLQDKIPSRVKYGYRPVGLGQRVLDDQTGTGI